MESADQQPPEAMDVCHEQDDHMEVEDPFASQDHRDVSMNSSDGDKSTDDETTKLVSFFLGIINN